MSIISIIKGFMALWPFIKEMFFAEKSLKQIILENKFAVFTLVALTLSLSLNYLSFSKIYDLAVAKKEDDAHAVAEKHKPTGKPVATQPDPPKPPVAASSANDDQYDRVLNRLNEIYGDKK